MREVTFLLLVASAALFALAVADDDLDVRSGNQKLISTFQIVRFPNDACTASTTRNGTCYTSAECSDKGGTSSGSCADGFGVCCQFVLTTCGSSSSENITYWDAPSTIPTGSCTLTICPINDQIGQLRLDFTTFVITGPSSNTVSEASSSNGWIPVLVAAAGTASASSWASNCLVDQFSVSSVSSSASPPMICGANAGYHMYVEADPDCNVLTFDFAVSITATTTESDYRGITTIASRDWDMTIYQYERGYVLQAPVGCTQYLFGPTAGWVDSYNWVSGATSKHLANQNQRVCIRRERGVCWIGFFLNAAGKFSFGGETAVANSFGTAGRPCGRLCEAGASVGAAGNMCSYDCAIIPGLFGVASAAGLIDVDASDAIVRLKTAAAQHLPAPPQLSSGGTVSAGCTTCAGSGIAIGDATAMTLFSAHNPFTVVFKSDGIEGHGLAGDHLAANGNANTNEGIHMNYNQITCT